MTKKRSSEIFTLKMDIFPEIGLRKTFLVPPNSAPGLRPWFFSIIGGTSPRWAQSLHLWAL